MNRHVQAARLIALTMLAVVGLAIKIATDYASLLSDAREVERMFIAHSILVAVIPDNASIDYVEDEVADSAQDVPQEKWKGKLIDVLDFFDSSGDYEWRGKITDGGEMISWTRHREWQQDDSDVACAIRPLIQHAQSQDKEVPGQDYDAFAPSYYLFEAGLDSIVGEPFSGSVSDRAFLLSDGYPIRANFGDAFEIKTPSVHMTYRNTIRRFDANSLQATATAIALSQGIEAQSTSQAYFRLKQKWYTQSVKVPVIGLELNAFVAMFIILGIE